MLKAFQKPARKHLLLLLLSALLILIIYFPSLNNFFLLDDLNWLKRGLSFYKDPFSLFRPTEDGFLRPVMLLLYAGLYPLAHLSPFAYYAFNIFLHMVNMALVYCFAYRIFPVRNREMASVFSALCFAVLFSHYQAVIWIAAVPHLVVTTCFLLSLLFYMHFRENGRALFYGLSLLAFIGAVFTRESAMALPVVVFFYEWLFVKTTTSKPAYKFLLPFLGIIAFHFMIYVFFVRFNYAGSRAHSVPFPLFVRVVLNCMIELFLTSFGYIQGSSFSFTSRYFAGMGAGSLVLFFVLLVSSGERIFRRYFLNEEMWKVTLFALVFTTATIAFVVSPFIAPYGIFHRNRYFYLPSVGFSLFLSALFNFIYQNASTFKKNVFYVFAVAVILLNSVAVVSVETYFDSAGKLSRLFYHALKALPCPSEKSCNLFLVDFPSKPWIVFTPPFFEQAAEVLGGKPWNVYRLDRRQAQNRMKHEKQKALNVVIEFKEGRFYNNTRAYRKRLDFKDSALP